MADPTRLVTRTTLYGLGYTNVYDTYLSPQEYMGWEARVSRESIRAVDWFQKKSSQSATSVNSISSIQQSYGTLPFSPSPLTWSRQSLLEGNVGYTHNRADNNHTLSALVHWSYALLRALPPVGPVRFMAGPMADLNGGFVYNMRNGNNPAQARAYINLGATGMAIYNLHLGRQTVGLRYQLSIPLLGLMFSPHYGQSYYEIFSVGNTSGIINFTSLHNQPSLRQMLSADFLLGRTRLRLAYVCDIQQSRLHSIETHTYSHVFMLGVVRNLYLVPNKKRPAHER